MADATPGTPPAAPTAPTVAGNGQGQSTGPAPAPPSAQSSAPLFGGFRGGRPRKDGLVPGSPEALEADREKDRLRKARSRASQRGPEPPPLPGLGIPHTAPQAPLAPVFPGVAGDPGAPLPWDPGMLKPIFDQLIPAAEQMTVRQVTTRAEKGRLPGDLVKDIEADARWNDPAKKAISISGPQCCAKWLNTLGLSSENQAEVIFGTAVASILAGHVMLVRKLDQLIAQQAKASAETRTEPKPLTT